MYISLWENSRGHPDNVSFYAIFYENWWFRTKRFTVLWELIQLLWTIPITEMFHFHHLPKLYFGFKALPPQTSERSSYSDDKRMSKTWFENTSRPQFATQDFRNVMPHCFQMEEKKIQLASCFFKNKFANNICFAISKPMYHLSGLSAYYKVLPV